MGTRSIKKILIANRGEIAVRVIRTCKELGIATVAIYSDVDRSMPHVLLADEAYHIGPPPSRQSYLAIEKILAVAKRAGAHAIHPGYGFLSENEMFAQHVIDAGLAFIGPQPGSIRAMGDKTEARRLVKHAGVPIVPGTDAPVSSELEARSFGDRVGYPVLIKAAAGGGGKGMRIVRSAGEMANAFRSAGSEALSAFADGRVYLEKYLENPRHIEFQILADKDGTTVHLGERECSIQRRHQKVIEETPSVIVDEALRASMGEIAVKAARAAHYENAGTVEFLVDRDRNFYFLEMNTRLQVEHPITELRTGIDIVAQQIRIAMGERLPFTQGDIHFRGHSIECRIYAEDPENDFLPSTGTITHLKSSQGFGIREDRGVEQGGPISVYYDPLISKLCAWGTTRSECIGRMRRALVDYEILGVKTNIPLNLFVLQHPKFVEGDFDTHFLSNYYHPGQLETPSQSERLAAACVLAMLHDRAGRNLVRDEIDQNAADDAESEWKRQRIESMRTGE